MLVVILCLCAVLVALGYLGVLVGDLLRRLKDLEQQLSLARKAVAELNDVLAQAPSPSR